MIKETIITLAFGATLIEKPHQPDLPHKHYSHIYEYYNGIRAYGNMQVNQGANKATKSSLAATLVTQLIK